MNPFLRYDAGSEQMRVTIDPHQRIAMADTFTERTCLEALRRRDLQKRVRAACWMRLRALQAEGDA